MTRVTRMMAALATTILLTASCQKTDGINQFQPTTTAGWNCADTLRFTMPAISDAQDFDVQVQARLTHRFPLTELWLVIEQEYGLPDSTARQTFIDTAKIQLTDESTLLAGQGRDLLEYSHPLRFIHLHQGEGARIRIRQASDYEKLSGVHDIGILITPVNR